jgi:ribosomal protein S6
LAATREYELVLMLDPERDAPARDALAQEARAQIEAAGALKHENDWGLRKMTFEIARRNEADYRWFRFEAPRELLEQLGHNLKIADGVLRFRIFKVDPESPVIVPPAGAAASSSRERPAQAAPETATEAPQATSEAPQADGAEVAPLEAAVEPTPEPPPEPAAEGAPEASPEPAAEGEAEPAADASPESAPEPAE